MKVYRRLDGLKQDNNEWVKHVKHIVEKYNNTVHYTIEIKPNEAVKPSNHLWVAWHLQNAANNNINYEEITTGQMVRIMICFNKHKRKQTSLIKHTCQAGQVKNIKLLELIIIILC